MRNLLTSLSLLAASASALAADPAPLPEPGSLALVGIAGIAAAVAYFRKRK